MTQVVGIGPAPVAVEVTSLIGTNEEQKAEALSAIRIALQEPASSRGSKLARGMCTANADESIAVALTKTWERYIAIDALWAQMMDEKDKMSKMGMGAHVSI